MGTGPGYKLEERVPIISRNPSIGKTSPYEEANIFSKITFWWLTDLIVKGYRGQLSDGNIYEVVPKYTTNYLTSRLLSYWNKVRKTPKTHSLMKCLLKTFWRQIVLGQILIFISYVLKVMQPLLVQVLTAYIAGDPNASWTAMVTSVTLLPLTAVTLSLVRQNGYALVGSADARMKAVCSSLIYRKVLRMSKDSLGKFSSGKIINFLSTDIETIGLGMEFVASMWVGPVVVYIIIAMVYADVGAAGLPGLCLILLVTPAQVFIGRKLGQYRLQIANWTDKRISAMNEIITGMKVIKMYCWEKSFNETIKGIRRKECQEMRKSLMLGALKSSFFPITRLITLVIVVVFVHVPTGRILTVAQIVKLIGLIEVSRTPLTYLIAGGLQFPIQMAASVTRIQEFLLEHESTTGACMPQRKAPYMSDFALIMDHVYCHWSKPPSEQLEDIDEFEIYRRMSTTARCFELQDIDFNAKHGSLVAVVGAVGTGKTSLLMSILGEMKNTDGTTIVRGSVAYVPQDAWVFSDTVRENVLFCKEFNGNKYENTIEACALNQDIENFPGGDQTLVGERGVTLSGGQKARINLARAVYNDADIYLLDDPMSAVDPTVGKYIFEKCICGILKNKTRILVTHQLQYLKEVDTIYIMKNGRIMCSGGYEELEAQLQALHREGYFEEEESDDDCKSDISEKDKSSILPLETHEVGRWMRDEKGEEHREVQEAGSVSWLTYKRYVIAGKGCFLFPAAIFCLCLMVVGYIMTDWWLITWISIRYEFLATSSNHTGVVEHGANFYGFIYISLALATIILAGVQGVIFVFAMTATARYLHNKVFSTLMRTPIIFFHKNHSGIILNRFARDCGIMDMEIPSRIQYLLPLVILYSGVGILSVIVSPLSILFTSPLVVFIYWIKHFGVKTQQILKRLEALRQSPIHAHMSSSLQGLQVIKAYREEQTYLQQFERCLDSRAQTRVLFVCAKLWMLLRMDAILAVVLLIFALLAVFMPLSHVNAGLYGLSMVYLSNAVGSFSFVMWQIAEVESLMTSVERIQEYCDLDQEAPEHGPSKVSSTWPEYGVLEFDHVTLRYNDGNQLALSDFCLQCNRDEKIGIVGRTGAGKSSLVTALLRLVEPEGKIWIDGTDVTKIGLTDLRNKIAVIPQDPILFAGSLRKNLDPFSEYPDEDLWQALEEVQLKQKVQSMHGSIHMEVGEGGSIFSVGQRQLVCLARAILRNNKILVLDEATANVDQRTDSLIQMTIRETFHRCTVLCIAHRIHTVIDMDRILVLEEGVVQECGAPYDLLRNTDGVFYQMVHQLDAQERSLLLSMAKRSIAKEEKKRL